MTQTPAGWHPAPDRPGYVRYWSGADWTEHYPPVQPPAPAPQPSGKRGMACPHCGAVGQIKTKRVKAKKGVSGGKATGAVLTAGFSILATGLSRKEEVTECRCRACKIVWHVA